MNSILRSMAASLMLVSSLLFADATAAGKEQIPVPEKAAFVIALDNNEETLSLDPHRSLDVNSATILTGLVEGLVTYDPVSLHPVQGIASKISTSEDGLTWTIHIREEAMFSDGTRITAYTFRNSWFYLIDYNIGGDMASLLDMISGVREYRTGASTDKNSVGIIAENAQTLILKLTTPSPYMLNILCHPAFAPLHPINLGNPKTLTATGLISSGPYMVKSFSEKSIQLVKNPFYWAENTVQSKQIVIELRDPDIELLKDFMDGEVHWSQAYLSIPLLYNKKDVVFYPEYSTGFYYFSTTTGPYADSRVRRALQAIIPWDTVKKSQASLYPTSVLVPQDAYYKGAEGNELYDPELAFSLLEEAGYPEGKGLPPMYIAIHRGSALEAMTDQITDIWSQKFGIVTITDVVPFSVYLDDPEHSPYTMAYITWIGDFYNPFSFLNLWLSDSNFNPGKFSDSRYDELMRKALLEKTREGRYSYFAEAESYLLKTGALFPISHGISVNFINSSRISGWYPNVLNIHPIKYLSLKAEGSPESTF